MRFPYSYMLKDDVVSNKNINFAENSEFQYRINTMQTRDRRIYKVTLTGSIVNMVLLIMKFVAGILGNSAAMVADAIHSLSDVLTDIVVLTFVKLSSKPADNDHDYGHGKYETIATSIIGMALAVVAVMLGWNGTEKIIQVVQGERLESPGTHIMLHIEPVKTGVL